MKSHTIPLLLVTAAVLLASGCATSFRRPDGVATAVPAEVTELRAKMLRARAMRTVEAPSHWAAQRRWSPRRHFGPLYGNSPDVHLNSQQATFVYNRFFFNHPDAAVFQRYYGSTLPTNQPSLPDAIPGTLPYNDGFRDLRLGFDQLTYSSRYGGSLKLTFQSLEDFQVEYRQGNVAWDIAWLGMDVYVRPVPTFLNPNAPLGSFQDGLVRVEFRPQGVIGYSVSDGNLTVQESDPLPALLTALANSAQTIIAGGAGATFRRDAARFSYGLVHAAFWEEIGLTNNVTAIEISDGFFFPRTTAGRPVAVVSVQASNVRLNTEPGSEEINITVHAEHRFDGCTNCPTFAWDYPEIDDGESTPWMTVGVFPLDWDCGQLATLMALIQIREDDIDVFDDRFYTEPRFAETGRLDCVGMQTAFNNGQFGLYQTIPDLPMLILKDRDGGVEGALTLRMRISLIKQ